MILLITSEVLHARLSSDAQRGSDVQLDLDARPGLEVQPDLDLTLKRHVLVHLFMAYQDAELPPQAIRYKLIVRTTMKIDGSKGVE